MRGFFSLFADAALALARSAEDAQAAIHDVTLTDPSFGMTKANHGRMSVAQSKRAALKLRRRKAHRMHCRGRRS